MLLMYLTQQCHHFFLREGNKRDLEDDDLSVSEKHSKMDETTDAVSRYNNT